MLLEIFTEFSLAEDDLRKRQVTIQAQPSLNDAQTCPYLRLMSLDSVGQEAYHWEARGSARNNTS